MASTNTRTVVRICSPYGVNPPICDPALDVDAQGVSKLLQEHLRRRDEASVAALPVRDGRTLTRFTIQRLSRRALTFVCGVDDPALRAQRAIGCGCHRYTDADGEHTATTSKNASGWIESDEQWLDELFDKFGQAGIDEIGSAIIDWSRAGVAELTPFALPHGLRLSR